MPTALREPIRGYLRDKNTGTWVKVDALNITCAGCHQDLPIRRARQGYYATCRLCALRVFLNDLSALGIRAEE